MTQNVERFPIERKLSIGDLIRLMQTDMGVAARLFDRLITEGNTAPYPEGPSVYFLLGMLRGATYGSADRSNALLTKLQEDYPELMGRMVSDYVGPKRKWGHPYPGGGGGAGA